MPDQNQEEEQVQRLVRPSKTSSPAGSHEVLLIASHEHAGKQYHAGETIHVSQSQHEWLRNLGVIE